MQWAKILDLYLLEEKEIQTALPQKGVFSHIESFRHPSPDNGPTKRCQ